MTDETPYAIGHADRIGLVVATGICTAEYDLKQAQDEGYAKFLLGERDEIFETDELGIGENISVVVAREAMDEMGDEGVYGFTVPDYLLARFITEFPDLEVYRQ